MTTLGVRSSWLAGALFQTLASPRPAWPGDNFLCGSAGLASACRTWTWWSEPQPWKHAGHAHIEAWSARLEGLWPVGCIHCSVWPPAGRPDTQNVAPYAKRIVNEYKTCFCTGFSLFLGIAACCVPLRADKALGRW